MSKYVPKYEPNEKRPQLVRIGVLFHKIYPELKDIKFTEYTRQYPNDLKTTTTIAEHALLKSQYNIDLPAWKEKFSDVWKASQEKQQKAKLVGKQKGGGGGDGGGAKKKKEKNSTTQAMARNTKIAGANEDEVEEEEEMASPVVGKMKSTSIGNGSFPSSEDDDDDDDDEKMTDLSPKSISQLILREPASSTPVAKKAAVAKAKTAPKEGSRCSCSSSVSTRKWRCHSYRGGGREERDGNLSRS